MSLNHIPEQSPQEEKTPQDPLEQSLLNGIRHSLEIEGLFAVGPKAHVVLAYSGGMDSTVLLFLLAKLRETVPFKLTAAYYNHHWRDNPPAELPLVHQNCIKANVPLVIIPSNRTLKKTEGVARDDRYRQLLAVAKHGHADAVLTAHHADDQIETVLFRILRGTGMDGLSGIQHRLMLTDSQLPVIRPLLDTPKASLRDYCQRQGLRYFEDPTNRDMRHQRNRIRQQILPYLESAFPQIKNTLFRLSITASGDAQIIEDAIGTIWKDLYRQDERGPYMDALRFNQMSLPYQRRLLKRFLQQSQVPYDFHTIEDTLEFIRGEGRKNLSAALKSIEKTSTGKTRFLSLYRNQLRIISTPAATELTEPVAVTLPGDTRVEPLRLMFKAIPLTKDEQKVRMTPIRAQDTHQLYVDLKKYADKPLVLRTRKPGDRFQPMGMDSPMRFKKYLINRGVPRFERNNLLVLAHESLILWAPGLGINEELKVKTASTHLLRLEYDAEPSRPVPMLIPAGLLELELAEEKPKAHRGPFDADDDDDSEDEVEQVRDTRNTRENQDEELELVDSDDDEEGEEDS